MVLATILKKFPAPSILLRTFVDFFSDFPDNIKSKFVPSSEILFNLYRTLSVGIWFIDDILG